jgi:glyoxylase-like metal-dependent hydrolase (beta-lactamase superfamily II)
VVTLEEFTRPVSRAPDDARAFRLADDLWSLVLPLGYIGIRSVNAYLLTLADGLALIDCGSALDPGWEALSHAVSRTGNDVGDIRLLVCTHLHMDHAGLAATVAERIGCDLARGRGPDAGHDAFRDRLVPLEARRRRAAREGVPDGELEALIGPLIANDGWHERARFQRVLDPGERLAGMAGSWEVVPATGHAAAQITLFESARRWLISADLVTDIPMLEYGTMGDPVALHRASLARILALDAECLLPGHGRPLQPAAMVRRRLLAARSEVDRLVDLASAAIAQSPHSGYEVSQLLDPGNLELEWRQAALSIGMCALEHLELTGRARSVLGHDGVRRFTRADQR